MTLTAQEIEERKKIIASERGISLEEYEIILKKREEEKQAEELQIKKILDEWAEGYRQTAPNSPERLAHKRKLLELKREYNLPFTAISIDEEGNIRELSEEEL